jgi:hypothetical protein
VIQKWKERKEMNVILFFICIIALCALAELSQHNHRFVSGTIGDRRLKMLIYNSIYSNY